MLGFFSSEKEIYCTSKKRIAMIKDVHKLLLLYDVSVQLLHTSSRFYTLVTAKSIHTDKKKPSKSNFHIFSH